MNAIVKADSLKSAKVVRSPLPKVGKVKAITPQDGEMYWIQRKTASANLLEPEIAQFRASIPGRSFYPGKWQIFDRCSLVYHTMEIRVISKVERPEI